ncbi:hypothetical protein CDIK_0378 [Cucumispora dikerogammari]|nr:hypothetical protein CDIK_0378 [Cucumispora dikerogammari]
MLFQLLTQIPTIFTLITDLEREKMLTALEEASNLKISPIIIQVHASNPNTLQINEEPQVLGTIKPERINGLSYSYKADSSLLDICKEKQVFVVLSCPKTSGVLNYTASYHREWKVLTQSALAPRVFTLSGHKKQRKNGDAETLSGFKLPDDDKNENFTDEESNSQSGISGAESEEEDNEGNAFSEIKLKNNVEIITKYIVYAGPKSPKSIEFEITLKPIFSIDVTKKAAFNSTKYTVNISRNNELPSDTLEKIFKYINNEGKTETFQFKHLPAYPETNKITSEYLDVDLNKIYSLMNQNNNLLRNSLIPAVELLKNMKTREYIQKKHIISSEPKRKNLTKNIKTSTVDTELKNTFEYNFISTLTKYEILNSVFVASFPFNPYKNSISHLQNTCKAIFESNTSECVNACIKAHLLYAYSKGESLKINCLGIIESPEFFEHLDADVLSCLSENEKELLSSVGCKSSDVHKHTETDTSSLQKDEKEVETDDDQSSSSSQNNEEPSGNKNEKRNYTPVFVTVGVVTVVVASAAVYYALA